MIIDHIMWDRSARKLADRKIAVEKTKYPGHTKRKGPTETQLIRTTTN
jgi:hypothetical protein